MKNETARADLNALLADRELLIEVNQSLAIVATIVVMFFARAQGRDPSEVWAELATSVLTEVDED